jgi:phosphorylcholine metabolism protein LicD
LKYFSEIGGCGHYDARFFDHWMTLSEIQPVLKTLFHEWHAFCESHNVTYILAHGTLLGWWWGRELMPWDTDLDVQMLLPDMEALYLNHSKRNFPDVGTDNAYLLEFNLNFRVPLAAWANVIDMRFIHKGTGLFIDITNLFPITQTEIKHKFRMFS